MSIVDWCSYLCSSDLDAVRFVRRRRMDPSVVDQYVDAAILVGDILHDSVHRILVGDVTLHGDRVRTDFVRSRRRGSHIEIELDDPYSLSRKRMTKGFAKSARSARDHRDAIQIGRASCRERVCQTV